MVIPLLGNNMSQLLPNLPEKRTCSFLSLPRQKYNITTLREEARVAVLNPESRKEGKKKEDFTCHLHSWRAGLTAVLFNSSDTLAVKSWANKWTERGERGSDE